MPKVAGVQLGGMTRGHGTSELRAQFFHKVQLRRPGPGASACGMAGAQPEGIRALGSTFLRLI